MDASAVIENNPDITHRETLALYYVEKNVGLGTPIKALVKESFAFADDWIAASKTPPAHAT